MTRTWPGQFPTYPKESNAQLTFHARRACAAMTEEGLDGLLLFRQESMYYLTGYDAFGFVFFQCVYLGAAGDMFC